MKKSAVARICYLLDTKHRLNLNWKLGLALALTSLCSCQSVLAGSLNYQSGSSTQVRGIVWQIDNQHLEPRGNWDRLGVSELLIQWTEVDGIRYLAEPDADTLQPDWPRIANEPWAKEVIVGLAGNFDERLARDNVSKLIADSVNITKLKMPFNVVGWYFPVEVDSSWLNAHVLREELNVLPRPLWISVYDSANVGAHALAQSLASWLPQDIGILFQDGVGVHAREASVAREYVEVLKKDFGEQRVRIIAEAFRPKEGGGFRPATAEEIKPQLAAYAGFSVYLFDGPHYLNCQLVNELVGSESTELDSCNSNNVLE